MSREKSAVPRAAREFHEKVASLVERCELGDLDGAKCLKEIHTLVCQNMQALYREYRKESGDPLPEVTVETFPHEEE